MEQSKDAAMRGRNAMLGTWSELSQITAVVKMRMMF
jgi:hypothetical protein